MPKKIYASNEVTDEVIAEWKAKYGEVHQLLVDREALNEGAEPEDFEVIENGLVGYIRKPSDVDLGYAYFKMGADFFVGGAALLERCWLGGDEEILTGVAAKTFAARQMIPFIDIRRAQLKKL